MKFNEISRYYVALLERTDFPHPEYRGEKLKAKLLKHELGKKTGFASTEKTKGKFSSQIIFSNAIGQADAIRMAYKLGTEDSISQVAQRLRDAIRSSFHKSEKMPWPPTASYLESLQDVVPGELERFLKVILSGKDDSENTRVNKLVFSIGQDICRAATNGQ